jgi:hypothetical protein
MLLSRTVLPPRGVFEIDGSVLVVIVMRRAGWLPAGMVNFLQCAGPAYVTVLYVLNDFQMSQRERVMWVKNLFKII